MNIKRLQIENFLRVSAVDITPDGNVIMITGKNGEGKTSVLNAIWAALSNPRYSEIPEPIHEGEEKAIITIDLDQYTVTRIFSEKGTTLKVAGAEGAIFQSPQKLLDKLLGSLTFDPLAFIDMKDKVQIEMLLQLAGSEIDIEALDSARESAYTQRTAVNQSVKTLSAARGEEPEKVVKIDLSIIQKEMTVADDLRRSINEQSQKETTLVGQIDELQNELVEVENFLAEAKPAIQKYKTADDYRVELNNGIEHNQKVGDWEKWNQAGKDIVTYSDKANEYTNQIDEVDKKKKDAIAAIEFPYPGLSFGESGVVFNGFPLKQASKAEQIRVSMAVAMALNPKLRVLRIEDGSLLDEDNLKLINDLAEEKDYQVWIERVKGEGEVGILIEDGTNVK